MGEASRACVIGSDGQPRCAWARSEAEVVYHDEEWGTASYDDTHLFEMLCLEGAQAGLSWSTILNKREGYRLAFHGFAIDRVARMNARDVERLVKNPAIVRHRGKIEATITNAKAARAIQEEHGSLSGWLWALAGSGVVVNHHEALSQLPARTAVSTAMSKSLLKAGFRFVGPTTCYAFMQAVGMVDDHLACCWKRAGG